MYKLQMRAKGQKLQLWRAHTECGLLSDALHNVKKFKVHGPPDGKSERPIEKIDTRMSSARSVFRRNAYNFFEIVGILLVASQKT